MWTEQTESSADGRTRRIKVHNDGITPGYADVLNLWQADESFRCVFMSILRDVPYTAFYWETPAVTRDTLERPFEFVLIDSPSLAGVPPDMHAFSEHFDTGCDDTGIVSFANLGGDAFLVAPCPVVASDAYAHIGAFTRKAPLHQQHALWQSVGRSVEEQISEQPLWVSTAGLGVFWLHVRLDSRPKYYSHAPYRKFPYT